MNIESVLGLVQVLVVTGHLCRVTFGSHTSRSGEWCTIEHDSHAEDQIDSQLGRQNKGHSRITPAPTDSGFGVRIRSSFFKR